MHIFSFLKYILKQNPDERSLTPPMYGSLAEMLRAVTESTVGKLARNTFYPNTRISIESGGDIQIDSCRRILVCSDVCIKIRSADMIIELWGSGLRLSCAEPDSVSVSGKVTSVEFTPAKKVRAR